MRAADATTPLLDGDEESPHDTIAVTHRGILREWVLLGWTAFGGPAAHVGIFRKVPDHCPMPPPPARPSERPAVSVVIKPVPVLIDHQWMTHLVRMSSRLCRRRAGFSSGKAKSHQHVAECSAEQFLLSPCCADIRRAAAMGDGGRVHGAAGAGQLPAGADVHPGVLRAEHIDFTTLCGVAGDPSPILAMTRPCRCPSRWA